MYNKLVQLEKIKKFAQKFAQEHGLTVMLILIYF